MTGPRLFPTELLDERLPQARRLSIEMAPDEAARILKLQLSTGLPRDFIARNLDQVEARSSEIATNPEEYRRRNPFVAQWLAEHPDHVALAKDDLSQLGVVEGAVRALQRGWQTGKEQSWLGRWGAQARRQRGQLTLEQQKQIDVLNISIAREPTGRAFWQDVLYRGALVGGVSGLARYTFMVESGQAYLELSQIRGEEGETLDENAKQTAAIGVGVINAALELTGEALIARPYVLAARRFMRQTAKDLLVRPTMRSAMANFGKSYALAIAGETTTEVMQEMTNVVAEELAKTATRGDFTTVMRDPEQREAMVQRLADIADQVGKGMLLVGLPGAGVHVASSVVAARRAQTRADFYRALGEGVTESKTFQRLPEALRDVVARATRDGPLERVFIDQSVFFEYWQSKNADPREMARELWGSAAEYDHATATGESMALPTADYATRIAPTEHNTFFADELRRAPGELNAREGKELEGQLAEQAKTVAPKDEAAREALTVKIGEQLQKTGVYDKTASRSLAEQMSAFFKTMAARTEQTAEALFNRYGVTITKGEPLSAGERAKSFIEKMAGKVQEMLEVGKRRAVQEPGMPDLSAALEREGKLFYQKEPSTVAMLPGFYSKAERIINERMGGRATPREITQLLKNAGVKAEELEWMHLQEFFENLLHRAGTDASLSESRQIAKIDLLSFMRANRLNVREIRPRAYIDEHAYRIELEELGQEIDNEWREKLRSTNIHEQKDGFFVVEYEGKKKVFQGADAKKRADHWLYDQIDNDTAYQDRLNEAALSRIEPATYDETEDFEREYMQYTLPGGTNYGELVFTLPDIGGRGFAGGHFREPNVFAHVRFKDRIDTQGRKMLFLEEVQSDWHERGRKSGYANLGGISFREALKAYTVFLDQHGGTEETIPDAVGTRLAVDGGFMTEEQRDAYMTSDVNGTTGVPDAPFKKTWHEFVMKRMLQKTVDGGYDALGWTTGDQQNTRYSLEMHLTELWYDRDKRRLSGRVTKESDRIVIENNVMPEDLPAIIGEELADRLMSTPLLEDEFFDNVHFLEGKDMKVSGSGMRGFYDKMLVDYANKLGKRGEARVENGQINILTEHRVLRVDADDFDIENAKADAQGNTVIHELVLTDALKTQVRNVGFELFQEGERGKISFGPDREVNIPLLEKADFSTFLHESGHLYLEVFTELMKENKALIPDYARILDFIGAKPGAVLTTEQHEKWARAIETYFREGRAPSLDLREAFRRFRTWLMALYATMRGLNVRMTDEVRGVMDRMFATDVEIDSAENEAAVTPLFTDAASAGMSEEEFMTYRDEVQRAHDAAVEKLQFKLMREQQREQTAEWRARRAAMADEVAQEVNRQPVYAALLALQRGERPDGTSLDAPIKLSKDEIVALKDEAFLHRLPRPYVYAKEGGVNLTQAAELFGFSSPDEMLTELAYSPHRDVAIERLVNERLKEKYGDLRLDGAVSDEAEKAVLGAQRETIILAELRALRARERLVKPQVTQAVSEALTAERAERAYERRWLEAERKLAVLIERGAKQEEVEALRVQIAEQKASALRGRATLRVATPSLATVRALAEERIADTKVRDLRPQTHWVTARRAGREAIAVVAKQDWIAAANAKQAELLSVALYREATRAQERADRIARYARRLDDSAAQERLGKAGSEYRDQINRLLERFDFTRLSLDAIDRRASLAAFIKSQEDLGLPINISEKMQNEAFRKQEDLGLPINISEKMQNEAFRKPWREMTMEELEGLRDVLRHVEHLARLKNTLLTAQRQRSFELARAEVVGTIVSNAKRVRPVELETRLPSGEVVRAIQGFFASHRKLSSLLREMGGFVDGGPLFDYLQRPINRAADAKTTLTQQITMDLHKLFDGTYSKVEMVEMYRKTAAPALGTSLTRMARVMMALNWGAEDNRVKLVNGLKIALGREVTESDVEATLTALEKKDWEFAQSVWNYLRTYWPQMKALAEELDGVAPDEIPAALVTTRFGEYAGGYFPLVYDERLSRVARQHTVEKRASEVRRASAVRASTKAGSRYARVTDVQLPVPLYFGVIFEHLEDVAMDLTHTRMLIDVNRLLRSDEIEEAVRTHYGDVVYQSILSTVRDIAAGDLPAQNWFDRSLNWVRTGTSIVGLGWNTITAAIQPLGLTQSVVRIGPKWVGKGLARWMRDAAHMENSYKWITAKSEFMAHRGRTQLREIDELRNHIGMAQNKLATYADLGLSKATLGVLDLQDLQDSFFWFITRR